MVRIAKRQENITQCFLYNLCYFIVDKFDQFWAVNRKLMEVNNDQDYFKYIPFRCYVDDGYKQKLVKPIGEDGHKKSLLDLLIEVFPGKSDCKWCIFRSTKISFTQNVFYSQNSHTRHGTTSGHPFAVDVRASQLPWQFFAYLFDKLICAIFIVDVISVIDSKNVFYVLFYEQLFHRYIL